jgi:Flp pilus assembly protein TadB
MLHDGVTAATWVIAFLGVAGFIGRVVTAVQERRKAEKRRKADRERIIAQQDRIIERRQERLIAQQRRDAAETQDR